MKTKLVSDAYNPGSSVNTLQVRTLDHRVVVAAEAGNLSLLHFMEPNQARRMISLLEEAIEDAEAFSEPTFEETM